MGGRCAVAVAVVLWIGTSLGGSLAPRGISPWIVSAIAVPIALLVWLTLRAPQRTATVGLLLAVLLAGLGRGAVRAGSWASDADSIRPDQGPHWLGVRLLGHPTREAEEPVAPAEIIAASDPTRIGLRVRLRLPRGCQAEWGDPLEALVQLDPLLAARNPGGFSSRDAGRAAGIAAQGRALVVREVAPRGTWQRATVSRWRRAIEGALRRHLSDGARELVTPLVIGDRSGLSPGLDAAFRASGLTHLLALSGLHVTWLAGVAGGAAAMLGAGPRVRALAGAACALFYVGVAGPLPSLARAAATEWLRCAARLSGRALDPVQALAASAVGALVVAPGWAGDLGFQLSCAATLGLVTVGDRLGAAARELPWPARAVVTAASPTLAAQLTALPLLIARFHALPWVGLASNLVAVPVSGVLLASAWLGAALECALPGFGRPWLAACEPLAWAFRGIASWAARAPAALVAVGPEPCVTWLSAAGAVVLAIALPGGRALHDQARRPTRLRVAAAITGPALVMLATLLGLTARPLAPAPGTWWLVTLDVGQGDALALGFDDGWWLVDAGPRSPHYDAGTSAIVPFFLWTGTRTLETLALTHDDGDHTGGTDAVRRSLRVDRIVAPVALPAVVGPGRRFAAHAVARGDTLRGDPLVLVRWPPRGAELRTDNAASLVLEVGEGRARALLAADVDSTVEESLAVESGLGALKVAHHGSASSSGVRFLSRIAASEAVVSTGRRNPYGHPQPGTLARLERAGCVVHRTDREGAVWLELSSRGARPLDWRRGPPRHETASRPPPRAPRP